jgi:hypothetical protein
MDVLIIAKWLAPKDIEGMWVDKKWPESTPYHAEQYDKIHFAPPIITTTVDSFLSFASNKDESGKLKYHYVFGDA